MAQQSVDGFDTTLGCSSRVGKPEKRTAWIVDQLEKRGAIMIASESLCCAAPSSNAALISWITTH